MIHSRSFWYTASVTAFASSDSRVRLGRASLGITPHACPAGLARRLLDGVRATASASRRSCSRSLCGPPLAWSATAGNRHDQLMPLLDRIPAVFVVDRDDPVSVPR